MDDWGCLCAASDTDLDTLRYCGGPDPQQKTAEDKTADRVFLVWISLLWILKSTSMIILYRISKRKKLPPTKVLATPEDTSAPKKSNRKKQSNQSSRRARHFPSKPEPPLNPLPDDLQGMRIGQSRVVSWNKTYAYIAWNTELTHVSLQKEIPRSLTKYNLVRRSSGGERRSRSP